MAPSDTAILEGTVRLVNIEMHAVALQRRRLASSEPEDDDFPLRWWTDLQFFILALSRLRRHAKIALGVPSAAPHVEGALATFDSKLPDLKVMRDVGEHGDEYAVNSGRMESIDARQLEVGGWDGQTYQWLGFRLNVDEALAAGEVLFESVKELSPTVAT